MRFLFYFQWWAEMMSSMWSNRVSQMVWSKCLASCRLSTWLNCRSDSTSQFDWVRHSTCAFEWRSHSQCRPTASRGFRHRVRWISHAMDKQKCYNVPLTIRHFTCFTCILCGVFFLFSIYFMLFKTFWFARRTASNSTLSTSHGFFYLINHFVPVWRFWFQSQISLDIPWHYISTYCLSISKR